MDNLMRPGRPLGVLVALVALAAVAGALSSPPAARSQAADVLLNVLATGAKKLNIVIPNFTVVAGTDSAGLSKGIPQVAARDLTFSALFSVVTEVPPIAPGDPAALRAAFANFAAAGAHAGLHGLLTLRGDRAEVEMRLHDLTSPEFRLIGTKKIEMPTAQARRLAHKIADEVVMQFTGELGIADTKIAYVGVVSGNKEVHMMDYDGANPNRVTSNKSINLSPVWSPDTRSLAFTSYMRGYPYLYRMFPFENRPVQVLAGFLGINTSPAFSPDGRSVALTLSRDGNPEVYVLNLATGAFRRLTSYAGIDTEPSWSPTGREMAFVSERAGGAQIFIMDAEGANVRRVTQAGFNTQPRWSPKGDTIVYTSRQGNFDLWAVSPDGSNLRRLTAGPGNNEGASWAPNGRHLVFQSNRSGSYQLFTMLADGSEQQPLPRGPGESTSASWSPRLP
ncbi:MAG TPA: Tol-Pal system beta propeller repeat protein TolB [Candidatus Nitrosotalea sp.]|nr:Tol-Pal system beta propeller repeat protein TolB [Candidatus Nitrosotalea sp.]